MSTLPTDRLVRLWEQGLGLSPLARTLLLAQAAQPDLDPARAESLSLGARDRLLYELREKLFGFALPLYTRCRVCRIDLELHLTHADVRAVAAPTGAIYVTEHDGITLEFRLPCSADLWECCIPGASTNPEADLLARCVRSARRGDVVLDPCTLPADVIDALAEAMAEKDPQAEVIVDLHCPGCQHVTQAALDIGTYLWAELDAAIRRLLLDVHVLAQSYGWSETEVFSLSSTRRQLYLDAIEAGR